MHREADFDAFAFTCVHGGKDSMRHLFANIQLIVASLECLSVLQHLDMCTAHR